ncbi:hypothetical protein [Sporichthya sp.]|uniref:hypothetical protein n=1 Tax=Sporichthya sp. TaxID=65475 RepID=UPI0017E331E1|nr:hypothetical protein [Sporichthya sp.]MBA3743761.1 hypothetical protein [Sporichthya sp.]
MVALAACVGGIAVARSGGNATAEFVAAEPEAGYVMSLKKSERTFTLSSIYIQRPGDEVRVLEVRALTSPNIEFIGAVNVWPSEYRATPLSVGPGYPAPELKVHHPLQEAVPAAETSLAPQPGVTSAPPLAVAAGFRVVSGDLGAVNGVRVVYTANGKKVTETFHEAVIVCVDPRPCDEPEGMDFNTWRDGVLNQFGLLPKES